MEGWSDNILAYSIVDKYLEHSRVFLFENGGEREVWLSSADWMPRNFFRRVETAFPVEDPEAARRLVEVLETCLTDNVRARVLKSDGSYERLRPAGDEARDAQACFLEDARRRVLRAVEAFERGVSSDSFERVPEPRDRGDV
jgi:polyphosphate kinase